MNSMSSWLFCVILSIFFTSLETMQQRWQNYHLILNLLCVFFSSPNLFTFLLMEIFSRAVGKISLDMHLYNYISHNQLLHIPSRLYYDRECTAGISKYHYQVCQNYLANNFLNFHLLHIATPNNVYQRDLDNIILMIFFNV